MNRRPRRSPFEALLADPDLLALEAIAPAFDPLEVLATARKERPHTRFLAWLLDPHPAQPGGAHGLGVAVLTLLIRRALAALDPLPGARFVRPPRRPPSLVADGPRVLREQPLGDGVRAPDIRCHARDTRGREWVVLIENKLDADEGDGQLAAYLAWARARHPGAERLLIYVSPDRRAPRETFPHRPRGPHRLERRRRRRPRRPARRRSPARPPPSRPAPSRTPPSTRSACASAPTPRPAPSSTACTAAIPATPPAAPRSSPTTPTGTAPRPRAQRPLAPAHPAPAGRRVHPRLRRPRRRRLEHPPPRRPRPPRHRAARAPARASRRGPSLGSPRRGRCTSSPRRARTPAPSARASGSALVRPQYPARYAARRPRARPPTSRSSPRPRDALRDARPVPTTPGTWRWLQVGRPVELPRGFSPDDDARRVVERLLPVVGPHLAALAARSRDRARWLYSCDRDDTLDRPTDATDRLALHAAARPDAERVLLVATQPTGHPGEIGAAHELGTALARSLGEGARFTYDYGPAPRASGSGRRRPWCCWRAPSSTTRRRWPAPARRWRGGRAGAATRDG